METYYMQERVIAAIVLYKCAPEKSQSLQSLLGARANVSQRLVDLKIVVHDNSPAEQWSEHVPEDVEYRRSTWNSGLAYAYNAALSIAVAQGYKWLLTLDQDTLLPSAFLSELVRTLGQLDERPDVAAVAPCILAGTRVLSPNIFWAGTWPRPCPRAFVGISDRTVFAFNSGSVLRVAAVRQAGGYSPRFPLDYSDAFMYRQLAKFGKKVFVAGDLQLEHDFSMISIKKMQECVSPERYETMLVAESAFWDTEMSRLAGLERTLRLAKRMCQHLSMSANDNALCRITARALFARACHRRKHRIAQWRRTNTERLGDALQGPFVGEKPRVSVCMAAYNGSRFILAQLQSIVPQLGRDDEVVIVDDASQDGTPNIVKHLCRELESKSDAPRIVLLEQKQNLGVVQSFDKAIRSASGDILFLADQDDVWAAEKVQKVLAAFEARQEVTMVATGVKLIDENGGTIGASPLLKDRKAPGGLLANFLHNQFQGAALAFRASFIQNILPFPVGRLFLHDRWIGMRAILRGVGIAYIDEPLLYYRAHSRNYTRRFSRWKQIWMRIQLAGDLLRRHGQHL